MRPTAVILKLAFEEARKSPVTRSKMSALALDYNCQNVLAKAHNTRFFGQPGRWTIHAEERVLNKYRGHIPVLLICRVKQLGWGISKPCAKCASLLSRSRVGSIIYYNGSKWVYERVVK